MKEITISKTWPERQNFGAEISIRQFYGHANSPVLCAKRNFCTSTTHINYIRTALISSQRAQQQCAPNYMPFRSDRQ
jgi:hypothetical protein